MRYALSDVPALLRTPIGRTSLLAGALHRARPILYALARLHRRTLTRRTRVVAVVGSFGKTTAARAVSTALGSAPHPRIHLNAGAPLALALLRVRPRARHAVVEVGIDGPGQMARYARLVRPAVVVVTSVGSEHGRSLGTLDATRHEKAEMVRALPAHGTAVLNGDDPHVRWMAGETRARALTFGFDDGNEVRASQAILEWPSGTRLRLHAGGQTRDLRVRLIGRPMMQAILAAVAVAVGEGEPLDRVAARLEALTPAPGRLEPWRLPSGAVLLCDECKSPEETIDAALDVLGAIPATRRIVVLGDVSEPRHPQRAIYRRLGGRVGRIADRFVIVSRDLGNVYETGARAAGMPRDRIARLGRRFRPAVEALAPDLGPGDVVLIKGRDTQRLERIALALSGRPVRCELISCDAPWTGCRACPMLARGWGGVRVVL